MWPSLNRCKKTLKKTQLKLYTKLICIYNTHSLILYTGVKPVYLPLIFSLNLIAMILFIDNLSKLQNVKQKWHSYSTYLCSRASFKLYLLITLIPSPIVHLQFINVIWNYKTTIVSRNSSRFRLQSFCSKFNLLSMRW